MDERAAIQAFSRFIIKTLFQNEKPHQQSRPPRRRIRGMGGDCSHPVRRSEIPNNDPVIRKLKPVKNLIIILIISLCFMRASGQGYSALAVGFVPYENQGYFNVQLTAGYAFKNRAFVEYNQTVAVTSLATVPSFFQARAGYIIPWHVNLHLFGGGGVRPAYYNEEGKVKGNYTYGVYITHEIEEAWYLKAELCMNGTQFMPSIGVATTFCERIKNRR